MELDPIDGFKQLPEDEMARAKTSLRIQYEAQVRVIRSQIGDLEAVRLQLGLSQRKIAQLLMVDPSAWTRWTKQGDEAPPSVWRSLQWYMAVKDKIPGLTPQYFIGSSPQVLHEKTLRLFESEKEKNQESLEVLRAKVEKTLENNKSLEAQVQKLEKDLNFHKKLAIVSAALLLALGLFVFWLS